MKLILTSILGIIVLVVAMYFYNKITLEKIPPKPENRTIYSKTKKEENNEEFFSNKTDKFEQLDIKSCHSYLNSEQPNRDWAINARNYIIYYSKEVNIDNADEFALYSGIGVYRNRILRGFNPKYFVKPKFDDIDFELQENSTEKLFKKLLTKQTSEEMLTFISNLPNKNSYFLNGGKLKHILGFAAQYKYNNSLLDVIELGIPVFYSDIVDLIKADIDTSILIKVTEYSNLSISKRLKGSFAYTSLANIALKYERFDFAYFLIEAGSPTNPDSYSENGLDILTKHRNKMSQDEFIKLFEKIRINTHQPFNKHLGKAINKHLKTIGYTDSDTFFVFDKKLMREDIVIEQLVDDMHKQLLTNFSSVDPEDLPKHCINPLGLLYTNLALTLGQQKQSTLHSYQYIVENDDLMFDKILQTFGNAELAIKFIGEEKTLESKRKVYSIKSKQALNQASSATETKTEYILSEDVINKIFELARQRRWDEAITLLKSSNIDEKEIYTGLLHVAIYTNAEIKTVDWLIYKGGELLESTIFTLIQTNNVKLAEFLLKNGLNINYIDAFGNTSISNSVKFEKLNMLKFLLKNGAEKNMFSTNYNALDFALLQLGKGKDMIEYIDELLMSGYVVELSHIQIIEKIKKTNLKIYNKLVNNNPVFILNE